MTLYFPLGLLYLAGAAREAGHDVAVFDGTFEEGEQAFQTVLEQHPPDVVCIASWITVRDTALDLARMTKQYGGKVLIGGPDPTLHPDIYLAEQAVDIAVIGEGEHTLVNVLERFEQGQPIEDLPGTAYRSERGNVNNGRPEAITDLDTIPVPARDLIDVERYLQAWRQAHGYRSLSINLTRGCPDENCRYCKDSVMGEHLRRRSIDNIITEMQMLEASYSFDRFRIVDDLDGLGTEWLTELGKAMMAAGIMTPYEGLKPVNLGELPMLGEVKDICADRNAWIPTRGAHPHAPPTENLNLIRRRWESAVLKKKEHLEDP